MFAMTDIGYLALDVNAIELKTLSALLAHRNAKTGRCFPSVKRLAEVCNCHRSSVYKAVERLQEMGLLTTEKFNGKTHYTILPPPK